MIPAMTSDFDAMFLRSRGHLSLDPARCAVCRSKLERRVECDSLTNPQGQNECIYVGWRSAAEAIFSVVNGTSGS